MTYEQFLKAKALTVAPVGFEPSDFVAPLFAFQLDIVSLACKLGRFCIWADCGTMRKRGDNPEPVSGKLTSFAGEDGPRLMDDDTRNSINIWQRYASPVWMDINPSDTLQFRNARDNDDERHISPLQLDVIRRGIQLWSNPGDIVLSPFMGIGSEGHVALEMGRAFIGFELKPSYYDCAVKNLIESEKSSTQEMLFA